MAGITVLPCNCPNKYQDLRYGKGRRVHNNMTKDNDTKARCTSCGNERSRKK